jgi:hypothetical protein
MLLTMRTRLDSDEECKNVYFITFETSNGTLQLAVYNEHNGYYGHNCYIKSNLMTEL